MLLAALFALAFPPAATAADTAPPTSWTVRTPIVTYWAGPPMTDATARQMAAGGWNLVWCREPELDVAQRHGLRAQLTDPLLAPASLADPAHQEKLDALIARVRQHPALYSYFITDEPNAKDFPALGRLVAHLRERDPERTGGHISQFNNSAHGGSHLTIQQFKCLFPSRHFAPQ